MKLQPTKPPIREGDVDTLQTANEVLTGTSKKGFFARLLPFMGPAFVASVAYIDPGNFATNIQAGAQFGYMLLWVITASNLMAMLIQTLSAKLGIASGRNLAELCREYFPQWVSISMWVIMELVAMATDLAEFLGAAIGFNLLFGIPLFPAALLTALTTFIILGLERRGFRPLEAVITALVGVIALCYLIEMFLVKPDMSEVLYHAVVPQFDGVESVLLATGILGATVMPHVIFLHSSLTQNRIPTKNDRELKKLFRFQLFDVTTAMGLAGLVNGAMLIMASSTFYNQGIQNVGSIEQAYLTLTPLLGAAASKVFAISLLASGLSSSTVGTMAGQVIMQGFIHRTIPAWVRRVVTMAPPLIVIAMGLDPTRTLVLSQVVLSFGLPFAVIPLIMFTRRKDVMGILVNHKITTIISIMVAALIISLNVFLLYELLFTG